MNELNITELSKRLGISRITALRMLKEGAFPNAYKLNENTSPWRVPEKDVDEYLIRRKKNSTKKKSLR